MRLQVGLYAVYLLDWLTVFSKEQFLVLRLEDHASNVSYTMHRVFQFLSLGTTVALQTHGAGPELRGRRPCEGLAESRADSVSWAGAGRAGGPFSTCCSSTSGTRGLVHHGVRDPWGGRDDLSRGSLLGAAGAGALVGQRGEGPRHHSRVVQITRGPSC